MTTSDKQKIRILHAVGHLLRGGIETWLYDIVQRLDPTIYEHHVLVWTDEEEAFTEEFRSAGVAVHAITNLRNPLQWSFRLTRFIREHGPFDIIHTHGTQFHGLVMLLATLLGTRARVAHSHTDIRPVLAKKSRVYRVYSGIGHFLLNTLATRGLACSNFAAISMFGKNWRSDKRWQILKYGIDLRPYAETPDASLRDSLGIPAGRRVVGHVGRFELQKNHSFLLEIISALVAREPNAHFLLIGDGSLRPEFIASAQRRKLAGNITFLRDCRTVAQHMTSAMDAFVFPSIYEGLGIVAIEAQAAGLPCLMSTEIPIEAAFYEPLSHRLDLSAGAEGWAEALQQLPTRISSENPELRAAFEASDFNITTSAHKLSAIYESAVGNA